MQKAIILSTNDIKELIAEKYGVPIKNVVKSQYSFTVITETDGKEPPEPEESSAAAPQVGG